MLSKYKEIKAELENLGKLTKDELRRLQTESLIGMYAHHFENNRMYRNLTNINPNQIKSIEDLVKLPIIDKEELIENDPFVSVPRNEWVCSYQTSGTTGEPKIIYHNENDRALTAVVKSRGYIFGGVKEGYTLFGAMIYGPWAGGNCTRESGYNLGYTIQANTMMDFNWHIWALKKHKPDYIVCLPSYLSRLNDSMQEAKINPSESGIKFIFVCGDSTTEDYRDYFESLFKAKIRDLYCLTEFSCVAAECDMHNLHYWADNFLIEIINPKTMQQVKSGERGEVVISGLKKQTMPLLRYNTHDLAYLIDSECACGNKLPLMSHILGRSDDMMTIAGANIYPHQIDTAISKIEELSGAYKFIIKKKEDFKDHVTIEAELRQQMARAELSPEKSKHLNDSIISSISRIVPELDVFINVNKTVHPLEIKLLDYGSLSSIAGKRKKIFDQRIKRAG